MSPSPTLAADRALLHAIGELARRAGEVVMQVYAGAIAARTKRDASPVTDADERAEALIVEGLIQLTPQVPIVAEEAAAAGRIPAIAERFWLVDPLDGTREFIDRNGEFTVNVALVEHGRPVLGAVHVPAIDRLYLGLVGDGATLHTAQGTRPIRCRTAPMRGLTVMASRSHDDPVALQAFLAGKPVAELRHAGSSLKLCALAAGEADLYPRLGRTMEWDIAAGHAVLSAAGGHVVDMAGAELRYGKPGFENPPFIASGAAQALSG